MQLGQIAVIRDILFQPYPLRSEHCAIGALVRLPSGIYEAHLAENLAKIEAMYPLMTIDELKEVVQKTVNILNDEEHLSLLYSLDEDGFPANTAFGCIRFSKNPGQFNFINDDQYEKRILWWLSASCEPKRGKKPECKQCKKARSVYRWAFYEQGCPGCVARAKDLMTWKRWYGGGCPVDGQQIVEVIFQNGEVMSGQACNFDWGKIRVLDGTDAIDLYRVVECQ